MKTICKTVLLAVAAMLHGAAATAQSAEVLTTTGDLRFASLSLEMTASAPGNLDPTRNYLNRNQGLRLTGMSLYLPDGIQIKLDSDSTNH